MSLADEIRQYVLVAIVKPARRRGESQVAFTALQVHNGMGLTDRMPAVCGAIDAKLFEDYAQVTLDKREGPDQGARAKWIFKVLPDLTDLE